MLKNYLLLFLLLSGISLTAQDTCECRDLVQRDGVGIWAWFSKSTDRVPFTGICFDGKHDLKGEWKRYQNGYVVEIRESVYNGIAHYTYKEVLKDSIISIAESYNQYSGKLENKTIIYEKKGKRYRMNYTYTTEGKLMELQRERFLRKGEGKAAGEPDHVFNKDGYYYSPVQDGPYLFYGGRYGITLSKTPLTAGQYADGYKTGYWYEKYDTGTLKSTGWYTNDDKDSIWTNYHYNGKIESKGRYTNNGKDGEWKYWDYEGNLIEVSHFVMPFQEGTSVKYYPDGKLKSKEKYKDGKKHGHFESWYANGQIETDYQYWYDLKAGECKSWYANGQQKSSAFYKQGIPDGLFREWYEDGKIAVQNYYRENSMTDTSKTWYSNGNLKTVTVFNIELQQGSYSSWYENGKKEKKEYTLNRKRHGICSYWDTSGTLIRQISYADNIEEGPSKTWNSKGQLISEYNYSKHIRHGRCRRWDANGKLVFDRTYDQGKPLNYTIPQAATIKTDCAPDSANPFSVCEYNQRLYASDAAFIALVMMQDSASPYYDSVIVPKKIMNQIELILINVYNGAAKTNPELASVHSNSNGKQQAVYSVTVRFSGTSANDPEWISRWKNGNAKTGNPAIDKIIAENGLVLSLEKPYTYSYETTFTFVSSVPVNAMAIDRALKKADSRLTCYGRQGGYGGDHISLQMKPNYTYIIFYDQLGNNEMFFGGTNMYSYNVYADGEVDLVSVSKTGSGQW